MSRYDDARAYMKHEHGEDLYNDAEKIRTALRSYAWLSGRYDFIEMACYNNVEADLIRDQLSLEERAHVRFRNMCFIPRNEEPRV